MGPTAEEVVASGDLGDGNAVLAMAGDELVNCPLTVAVAFGEDLGPVVARSRGHPDLDGALV